MAHHAGSLRRSLKRHVTPCTAPSRLVRYASRGAPDRGGIACPISDPRSQLGRRSAAAVERADRLRTTHYEGGERAGESSPVRGLAPSRGRPGWLSTRQTGLSRPRAAAPERLHRGWLEVSPRGDTAPLRGRTGRSCEGTPGPGGGEHDRRQAGRDGRAGACRGALEGHREASATTRLDGDNFACRSTAASSAPACPFEVVAESPSSRPGRQHRGAVAGLDNPGPPSSAHAAQARRPRLRPPLRARPSPRTGSRRPATPTARLGSSACRPRRMVTSATSTRRQHSNGRARAGPTARSRLPGATRQTTGAISPSPT